MYKQLTSEQRYTISVLLQNRMKQKDIAKAINVNPSTVYREIRRNSGIRGRYNWKTAQANAIRTKRKKPGNHSVDDAIKEEAKRLLVTEQWWDKSAVVELIEGDIVFLFFHAVCCGINELLLFFIGA